MIARGRVTQFDDEAGHGVVTADDGVARAFHCTTVADGTRTVAVGAEVVFSVVPGRLGRWEATEIVKLWSAP